MGLHQILWLSCSLLQNWLPTYPMLIRANPPSGLPHRRKVTSTTLRSVTKRWRPDRIKCCLGKSWHLAMVAWCGMVLFGALLGHACSGRNHLLMGRCIAQDMLAEQTETMRTGGISQYFGHQNVESLWSCKSYGRNTTNLKGPSNVGNACTN